MFLQRCTVAHRVMLQPLLDLRRLNADTVTQLRAVSEDDLLLVVVF